MSLGAAVAGGLDAVSGATGTVVTQQGKVVVGVTATNNVLLNGFRVQIKSDQFGVAQSYAFNGLPPGLSGSLQGVVLGTPTQTGVFPISVTGWQFAHQVGFTSSGGLTLTVLGGTPLVAIDQEPTNVTVVAGAPFSVGVRASGQNLLYRWLKDGASVNAATNPVFSVASAQLSDAGAYAAIVSSGSLSVTSNPAVVTVNPVPPQFGPQPAAQEVYAGEAVTLAVTASGTGPLVYHWSFGGQPLSGGTNGALTLPSAGAANAGVYQVVVNGPGGFAITTASFTLAPPLQLGRPQLLPAGAVGLSFNAIPGRAYEVETTTNLAAVAWTAGALVRPAGAVGGVTNPAVPGEAVFYRILALPAGP